jgi:hypothetical protein
MAKDTKKENPLLSKNIPRPPAHEETNAGSSITVSDGIIPQSGKTVKRQDTVKREKVTFYLEADQSDKLYDLMEAFRKRTGVKINQQNMLRRILEVVDIDTVLP